VLPEMIFISLLSLLKNITKRPKIKDNDQYFDQQGSKKTI
jgi:hypothetical protein